MVIFWGSGFNLYEVTAAWFYRSLLQYLMPYGQDLWQLPLSGFGIVAGIIHEYLLRIRV
jgi:hypothetical protein